MAVGVGVTLIVAGGGGVAVGATTVGDCVGLVCGGAVTVRGRVSVEVCGEVEVCAWTKSAGASSNPHRRRVNGKFK